MALLVVTESLRDVVRGRGVLNVPALLQFDSPVQQGVGGVGDGQRSAEAPLISGSGVPSQSLHVDGMHRPQGVSTSTPEHTKPSAESVSQMGDIIQQVGRQLAHDILTQLSPSPGATAPNTAAAQTDSNAFTSQVLDLSQVQLVSHRKMKEVGVSETNQYYQ